MKRLVAILSIMVLAVVAMAQVPQTMNFQALIRNAENQVVTNQSVEIEVSVLNSAQQAVYTETHSVTTNFNGIVTLEVGAGTPVDGTFAGIDWSADRYYMETKIQLSDGSDAISDVTPLLSVPYALYAAKSGSTDIDLSDYALKSEIPAAVDLTDYALKSEIPAAVDLTDYALKSEIPAAVDPTDYALKSEIPAAVDLTDYALKSEIPAAVDLTDYALKSEIPAAVDLTDYALKSEIPVAVDLTDYALKSEIPAAVDLTDYALKSEIPAAVDLTDYALKSEIPVAVDLTDYALKSEIPAEVDLTDYAKSADVSETYLTKETFENYVLGAGQPESIDLTVYAKTADVNAALANIEAQIPAAVDLTNYALKSEIPAAVDLTDYALKSEIPVAVDLTDYALKSEIPAAVDLTDYAKTADVESAYAKKTALNEYAKSGANISIFVNDVEYVKKSYVDSLFNVLKTQIATISNGGGNGGEDGQHENGRINAKFSISADKQVYFSQGNLQYQASTKTWRFAENQYDLIGDDNENISSTYDGWIDLFGFGTSGYGDSHPYNSGEYDSYPNSYSIGLISETNYDWGYYNSISNGGGESGLWRTLTGEEWNYLFSSRTNAANLYGAAQVNGVNGVVILPDAWTLPDGVSFTKGFSATLLYELNTYTTTDWGKMEANGAVFLPAVGYRLTTTVNDAGVDGYYWSSIENKAVQFSGEALRTDYQWKRSNGYGVRAVQDVDKNSATEENNEGGSSEGEQGSNTEENPSGENTGNENEGGGSNENEEGETGESSSGTDENLDYEVTEYGRLYTTGLVDLGLSVKWAACNLGATSPDGYGDYYAWGETETKESYASDNSTTFDKSLSELRSAGIIDANNNLTANYDVAIKKLGTGYRMPTMEEQRDLLDNCTFVWGSYKGVNGCYIEGKNGNCIFLPATGRLFNTSSGDVGTCGNYWSSNVYEENSAYGLFFNSSLHFFSTDYQRFEGVCIRAVQDDDGENSTIEENNEGETGSDGEQGSNTEENPSGENTGNENEGGSQGGGSNENEDGETAESGSGTEETLDYEVTEYGKFYTTGMVDLGLSVKWAACNIGATSPDSYGDYYAWGETETKDSYASDNSTTYDKNLSELRSAGIIDANNNLTANYDVATQKLGTGYRMPTTDEMQELVQNCTWVLSTCKGVSGYYVEGKNGNCIFLPEAGWFSKTFSIGVGTNGYYWCSTTAKISPKEDSAYLSLLSNGHFISSYARYVGYSVRAVQDVE